MRSGSFSVVTNADMQFVDITEQAQQAVRAAAADEGLLCLSSPHTTAGLTINEGCDPAVQQDIIAVFRKLIPSSHPFRHAEGNSPAHVMTTLTGSAVTVIIAGGDLQLGRWQRIFFCEYDGPRSRNVRWKVLAG